MSVVEILYSPGVNGFFARGVHADIPPDAVTVTVARHAELLAGQSAGKRIAPGPGGAPVLLDPPPPGPPPVPDTVQLWQFRREVEARGWWQAMLDAVGTLPQPARADVEAWLEYGSEARRASPRLIGLFVSVMGRTEAELDAAFRSAAARTVES